MFGAHDKEVARDFGQETEDWGGHRFGLGYIHSGCGSRRNFSCHGMQFWDIHDAISEQTIDRLQHCGKGYCLGGIRGSKAFDNMTWNFVAVLRILDGNTVGMGYYKFTDTDGDFFVLEASGDTVMEGGTWKFLHGTGKWKGATGHATGKFIVRGKPVPLESEQYWCRVIGTIQLPK